MKASLFVIAFVAYLCTGCNEDLASRSHFEAPFSMYGVLTTDLDTQSVLVYPIEDFPSLGSPDRLNIAFTSEDLLTGEVKRWEEKLIRDEKGYYLHVFQSAFRAEYGHRYRLKAERLSDDAASFADVLVPDLVNLKITNLDDFLVDVLIEGNEIRVLKPEVQYVVAAPGATSRRYSISYQGKEKKVAGGWLVVPNLLGDRFTVQSLYTSDVGGGGANCPLIELRELNIRVLVGDSTWNPPKGKFDLDVLSHPTTMTNVSNGFGYIGGGYRIVDSLKPSRKAVEDACYYYAWD